MKWLPRIRDGYWLTPLQIKIAEMGFTCLGTLGVIKMFANIATEFYWMIGIVGIILIAWMSTMQFARYKSNYYRDKGTDKEEQSSHFMYLPFYIIPLFFCVVAGAISFLLIDIAVAHHIIAGAEEIVVFAALLAWLIYGVLDVVIIANLGKVEKLMALEKQAVDTGVKVAKNLITAVINGKEIQADKDTILELLKDSE